MRFWRCNRASTTKDGKVTMIIEVNTDKAWDPLCKKRVLEKCEYKVLSFFLFLCHNKI